MSQLYVIDRFEDDLAVCEHDGGMVNIPRAALPKGAAEGDALILENGVYLPDRDETERRREEIRRLQSKLFR